MIYERLKSIACLQQTVTYAEIGLLADLDMNNPADRNRIGIILGEISTFEHQHGRPLLSVLVIHSHNNIPGDGFFNLSRELNVYHGDDDCMFFNQELDRVYEYWRNI